MRLGIIADAIDTQSAGIHYYTHHLVKELAELDNEFELFLFRKNEEPKYTGAHQITIPSRSWNILFRLYRTAFEIPRYTKNNNLDVIVEPAHFGPLRTPKGVFSVTVIHDITPLLFPQWHPFVSALLQRMFLPKILENTDLIITNSHCTKSDLLNHLNIPEGKIEVAHLGISDEFVPTNRPDVLAKYGIYKDYILCQGTIEPRKNLIALIKAYDRLRQSNEDIKDQLILAGGVGWKNKRMLKIREQSEYKDDIIFLGYVDREDMPALYTGAQLFAFPSLYEGFGLPLLEAMACGVPIAASERGSIPEIGSSYPKYFDPENIDEMSSCMLDARTQKESDRKKQIDYARSFSWAKTALETVAHIRTHREMKSIRK